MTLRSMLGSWAAPLLIHNQNQNTAMIRAAAAKAQGLDPNIYGVPLPGSNVTTNNNNSSGFIKGALLSAAMLAAGAAAGNRLPAFGPPKAEQSASSQPAASQPSVDSRGPRADSRRAAYEAIVEQQQPDGTWKEISSQKLEPPTP
jgi:hypothetical protein